jgi:hypothetical protein
MNTMAAPAATALVRLSLTRGRLVITLVTKASDPPPRLLRYGRCRHGAMTTAVGLEELVGLSLL